MQREFYSRFEPSPYSFELFDAYYDVLIRGYIALDSTSERTTSVETLKAVLILFITFPKKALVERKLYDQLEEEIKKIKNEDDFKRSSLNIFHALSEIGLYIDLYKDTPIGEDQSNSKMVYILKMIGNNIIQGYEQSARRLMFMFYLSFRHKLHEHIDGCFFDRSIGIYELNRQLMSKGDEIGLFMTKIAMISGGITH